VTRWCRLRALLEAVRRGKAAFARRPRALCHPKPVHSLVTRSRTAAAPRPNPEIASLSVPGPVRVSGLPRTRHDPPAQSSRAFARNGASAWELGSRVSEPARARSAARDATRRARRSRGSKPSPIFAPSIQWTPYTLRNDASLRPTFTTRFRLDEPCPELRRMASSSRRTDERLRGVECFGLQRFASGHRADAGPQGSGSPREPRCAARRGPDARVASAPAISAECVRRSASPLPHADEHRERRSGSKESVGSPRASERRTRGLAALAPHARDASSREGSHCAQHQPGRRSKSPRRNESRRPSGGLWTEEADVAASRNSACSDRAQMTFDPS